MASFTSLLPLMLSAMAPSALAMAVDCAPTPPSPDGPVPWVRSWVPPALQHQFSVLRQEQPSEAMEEGQDPAFCPL